MTSSHLYKSYRLVILLMLMFTVYVWVSMRSNLGFAIVCMVNSTATASETYRNLSSAEFQQCKTPAASLEEAESELGYHGSFLWSKSEQSYLFSALFYGNLLTIGFSGTLADRFDPKLLILLSTISYTILTILTPLFVQNYTVYLVARFVMGLFDGLIFPATSSIIARWFPPDERSSVSAVYTSGNQISASVNVIAAGRLCGLEFLNGWPLIFYIWGFIGIIYILMFLVFVSNSPNDNKFIGEKEQVFLNIQLSTQHNGLVTKKLSSSKKIPWIAMLTSPTTWAVIASQFSFNYINTMWQTYLPTYFKDVLLLDLSKNGFFSAMPFITQLVFKLLMGFGADALKRANIISETNACKILQSIATFGTAIILLLMAFFVDCTNPFLGLVLLGIMGCLFAGQIGGAFTSSLCIAPSFTGTITSLSSFAGALANIAVPASVGLINVKGTPDEWQLIFIIAAAISVVTGLFFLIFGSAEIQPWAKIQKPQTVVVQSISLPNLKSDDPRRSSQTSTD